MNFYKVTILAFSLFSLNTWPTLFIPVSIRTQVKDSDSLVRGIYKSESYRKNKIGQVYTVAVFDINESANIDNQNSNHGKEIEVNYLGGKWGDITTYVFGTPQFSLGKEYVLLLNKKEDGHWIHNMSLGTFSLIKNGKIDEVVSTVFPHHKQYGKITYSELKDILKEEWKTDVKKFVLSNSEIERKTLTRKIASDESEPNDSSKVQSSVFEILFILFMLIGTILFILFIYREGTNKSD